MLVHWRWCCLNKILLIYRTSHDQWDLVILVWLMDETALDKWRCKKKKQWRVGQYSVDFFSDYGFNMFIYHHRWKQCYHSTFMPIRTGSLSLSFSISLSLSSSLSSHNRKFSTTAENQLKLIWCVAPGRGKRANCSMYPVTTTASWQCWAVVPLIRIWRRTYTGLWDFFFDFIVIRRGKCVFTMSL